jgi:Uma2 family endonuclease
MAVPISRRLFTVDEYYEMARAGILKPDERVELLDGEIVVMEPKSVAHSWCTTRVHRKLAPLAGRAFIGVHNPLRLNDRSEPEPDLTIIRRDAPQDRHPGPAETLLVIEVSDTSIEVDRGHKLPLYARAGIPEYWIVDLTADRIEVYRDPARGRYRSVTLLARGDTVSPACAPDIVIDVSTVLGNRQRAEA